FDMAAKMVAGVQTYEQEIAIQKDAGEQIIEIVSDSAGETSHSLEALGLAQAQFGLAGIGGVLGHNKTGVWLSARTGNAPGGPANPGGSTTGARPVMVDTEAVALAINHLLKEAVAFFGVGRADKVAEMRRRQGR